MSLEERKTLAWHETLEIHELAAAQAHGLMKLKMAVKNINDSELKTIYRKAIKDTELNLKELIKFYPAAPTEQIREEAPLEETRLGDSAFYAGDLLAMSKSLVRNYAIAITETATTVLRKTLTTQLLREIKCHEEIFQYMYKRGYYPAYDLGKLLDHDLKNVNKALRMG